MILGTIDSLFKEEIIDCTTSMQMHAYHDEHSNECIVHLQEKYYNRKLDEHDLIAISISTL